MKAKKDNYMEQMALYFAQRSVGKSTPILVHKVPKPHNLTKMLEEVLEE